MSAVKKHLKVLGAAALLCLGGAAQAVVISGTITDWRDVPSTYVTVGDAVNHIDLNWSWAATNRAWVAGGYPTGLEVAMASDISDVSELTDASQLGFTSGSVGRVGDVQTYGAKGSFVVYRAPRVGGGTSYAVLRMDDITNGSKAEALNATWWFQTDGTGNFAVAAVPEPGSAVLAMSGLALLGAWGLRRSRRFTR